MSEMVERVARAIYRNAPGPDGTEIFMEEPWRSCIDAAQAAIVAMREPTVAMVSCVSALAPTETMRASQREAIARDWQKMIDEALNG